MCEPAAQSRRRQDGPHATPALEFYRAFGVYRALLAKIFKNRPGHLRSSLHACQTYLAVPMWLRGCCWMLAAPWQKPLHQLPSICAHRCSTIVATLTHCRHLASGKHLAYAWQSLGNRVAILWQSVRFFGDRLFELLPAY